MLVFYLILTTKSASIMYRPLYNRKYLYNEPFYMISPAATTTTSSSAGTVIGPVVNDTTLPHIVKPLDENDTKKNVNQTLRISTPSPSSSSSSSSSPSVMDMDTPVSQSSSSKSLIHIKYNDVVAKNHNNNNSRAINFTNSNNSKQAKTTSNTDKNESSKEDDDDDNETTNSEDYENNEQSENEFRKTIINYNKNRSSAANYQQKKNRNLEQIKKYENQKLKKIFKFNQTLIRFEVNVYIRKILFCLLIGFIINLAVLITIFYFETLLQNVLFNKNVHESHRLINRKPKSSTQEKQQSPSSLNSTSSIKTSSASENRPLLINNHIDEMIFNFDELLDELNSKYKLIYWLFILVFVIFFLLIIHYPKLRANKPLNYILFYMYVILLSVFISLLSIKYKYYKVIIEINIGLLAMVLTLILYTLQLKLKFNSIIILPYILTLLILFILILVYSLILNFNFKKLFYLVFYISFYVYLINIYIIFDLQYMLSVNYKYNINTSCSGNDYLFKAFNLITVDIFHVYLVFIKRLIHFVR